MKKLIILVMANLVITSYFAQQERKLNIGISLESNLSLVSDARKALIPYEQTSISANSGDLYPSNFWNTGEMSFDIYLTDLNLNFSAGIRVFNFKYFEDSVNKKSSSGKNNFGRRTTYRSDGLPFLSIEYSQKLTSKISLDHSISVGYFRIISRYKENVKAYSESDQEIWEYSNRIYEGFNYSFRQNPNSFDFRIGTTANWNFNRFSVGAGLSYYYIKNLWTTHNGMYLRTGISYKFLK